MNYLSNTGDCLVVEYRFYSDAHITGQVRDGLGPYEFLNSIPINYSTEQLGSPIILRSKEILKPYLSNFDATDNSFYHGGGLPDELAALASLLIGARIRSGGESRRFDVGGDKFGTPQSWNEMPPPILRIRTNELRLPDVRGIKKMGDLAWINIVPRLAPTQYVNLVRACRLYQDALWIAESEPNLAWIMFVSALEVAANDYQSSGQSDLERLEGSKPEVFKLLIDSGGTKLAESVAGMISDSLGSTTKFVKFAIRFLPEPPDRRPERDSSQVTWSKSKMRKAFSLIYDYRSRALHGGIPFPVPMLTPARREDKNSPWEETPFFGHGISAENGIWLGESIPMNLHCFHYLTRGILRNWWLHLAKEVNAGVSK